MVGPQMADNRSDGGTISRFAIDAFGRAAALSGDDHPKPRRLRRILAVLAAVGDDAFVCRADQRLHLGKHAADRVPATRRRRHLHLDADFIRTIRLPSPMNSTSSAEDLLGLLHLLCSRALDATDRGAKRIAQSLDILHPPRNVAFDPIQIYQDRETRLRAALARASGLERPPIPRRNSVRESANWWWRASPANGSCRRFDRASPETDPFTLRPAPPLAASRISAAVDPREKRITKRPPDQFAGKPRKMQPKLAKTIPPPRRTSGLNAGY